MIRSSAPPSSSPKIPNSFAFRQANLVWSRRSAVAWALVLGLLLLLAVDLGRGGILEADSFSRSRKMKVHPAPRKRNITVHCNVNRSLGEARALVGRQKKLRRLPHIFSKVLELPFDSDANVDVQEDDAGFMFVVATEDVGDDVRAHAIQLYPGMTKVVIRDGRDGTAEEGLLPVDDLELNRWRFRLPSCTRPELAVAACVGGELVVRIPKGGEEGEDEETEVWRGGGGGGGGSRDISGSGVGRLVYVQ